MDDKNQQRVINDSLDLDTLFVVLLDRIDPLMRIFLFSVLLLGGFYIFDQRIYQSSTLLHFDQEKIVPGSNQLTSFTDLSSLNGKREIYKSIPTISGARDKLIQDRRFKFINC